jgi:hypothetical protein
VFKFSGTPIGTPMRWIVLPSHHEKVAMNLKIAITILAFHLIPAPSFLSEEIERPLLWTRRI